jgi:hypothetical protein
MLRSLRLVLVFQIPEMTVPAFAGTGKSTFWESGGWNFHPHPPNPEELLLLSGLLLGLLLGFRHDSSPVTG